MTIIKTIKSVLRKLTIFKSPEIPFFTKDIFKDRKFEIGDYTYGEPNVIFENPKTNLRIGKFCSIAENVTIFLGGNHRTDWITTYPFNAIMRYFPEAVSIEGHPATKGDVVIGNDVWLGKDATILSGITIGNGAVVAAGAVITKDIGPYEIWGGNPARLIKKRFDNETIEILSQSEWWNWELPIIKERLAILCSNDIAAIKRLQ